MKASEEKWGSQENVHTNLKKIKPRYDFHCHQIIYQIYFYVSFDILFILGVILVKKQFWFQSIYIYADHGYVIHTGQLTTWGYNNVKKEHFIKGLWIIQSIMIYI